MATIIGECPICKDENLQLMPYHDDTHHFCAECTQTLHSRAERCPICRARCPIPETPAAREARRDAHDELFLEQLRQTANDGFREARFDAEAEYDIQDQAREWMEDERREAHVQPFFDYIDEFRDWVHVDNGHSRAYWERPRNQLLYDYGVMGHERERLYIQLVNRESLPRIAVLHAFYTFARTVVTLTSPTRAGAAFVAHNPNPVSSGRGFQRVLGVLRSHAQNTARTAAATQREAEAEMEAAQRMLVTATLAIPEHLRGDIQDAVNHYTNAALRLAALRQAIGTA